jgi:hypothetical protein
MQSKSWAFGRRVRKTRMIDLGASLELAVEAFGLFVAVQIRSTQC